jgi:hypothetical protein
LHCAGSLDVGKRNEHDIATLQRSAIRHTGSPSATV